MRRRWTTFALAAAVSIAATYAPSAAAAVPVLARQDIIDNEVEDGTYTGTISMDGGYSFPAGNGGGVLVRADIDGEAQLIAQGGVVSGSWTYAGTGEGFIQGLGVDAKANINFAGQGTFSGTNTAARVLGTTSFTGTVTGGGSSQPFDGAAPTDEPIENLLAGCRQIVGTYTQRINEQIEAGVAGGRSNIRGVIALYSVPQTSQAELLAERASELRANPDEDAFQRVFAATTLLREIQEFQAELNATSTCPSTKEYFNLLTNVAADVIAEALNALEALAADDPTQAAIITAGVIAVLVELGVSTGAMGAGATDGRGTELMEAARERTQAAVDHLLQKENFNLFLLTGLAALSASLNWNLAFGDLTDAEVQLLDVEDPADATVIEPDDEGVDE